MAIKATNTQLLVSPFQKPGAETRKQKSTLPGNFKKLQFQTLSPLQKLNISHKRQMAHMPSLFLQPGGTVPQVWLHRPEPSQFTHQPLVFLWPLAAELCSPQQPHCSAFVLPNTQRLHSPPLEDPLRLASFSPSNHFHPQPHPRPTATPSFYNVWRPTPAVSTRWLTSSFQNNYLSYVLTGCLKKNFFRLKIVFPFVFSTQALKTDRRQTRDKCSYSS